MTDKPSINRQLIRRQPLFAGMNEVWFEQVVNNVRSVSLREGDRLFDHGQAAERFYLVVEGAVKLYRLSVEGHEKVIEIFRSGDLFAEAVMFLEHRRYPASATALQPSLLYAFDNRTFNSLLHSSNELCLQMLASLSVRLHWQVREISDLSLQNATFRVVGYLLDLLPDRNADSAVIELNAPKRVIASRLSITPETFSRILHTLTEQTIMSVHGQTIYIDDIQQLRAFGHYERVI